MTDTEEHLLRIREVGEHLLKTADALDRRDWELLRVLTLEISRQARVLSIMEKQANLWPKA